MRNLFRALICLVGVLMLTEIQAQPWTYDFGTGTGSYATASGVSTTLFTGTPSGGGTYRVRCATTGNLGTGFVLANPGTTLGTGTELQINASITSSTNIFGVYDWTSPSTVGYYKMKVRTTATATAQLAFAIGTNTAASATTGYTNNYANHLGVFWIAYTGGAISSVNRRNAGATTAITGSGLAKDTDQIIEVYANNGASSTTYSKGGTSYTLLTQTWDLWVDGIKVSPANGWAKAASLAAGTNLSGIAVYAETSSTNNGFVYIDDLEYSNSLPACTAPTTQASSVTSANITTSGLDVNWTNGSGAGRVVKMNTSNSFT
ncbi:MAG: hypothetical protein K1X54_06875, partial [Flavobacteriales bacterium]|nr:hypothetical protein [Flavobacteriales bacterium]